jgi:hypothetical protein
LALIDYGMIVNQLEDPSIAGRVLFTWLLPFRAELPAQPFFTLPVNFST